MSYGVGALGETSNRWCADQYPAQDGGIVECSYMLRCTKASKPTGGQNAKLRGTLPGRFGAFFLVAPPISLKKALQEPAGLEEYVLALAGRVRPANPLGRIIFPQ
jgi:hypothetical protein